MNPPTIEYLRDALTLSELMDEQIGFLVFQAERLWDWNNSDRAVSSETRIAFNRKVSAYWERLSVASKEHILTEFVISKLEQT